MQICGLVCWFFRPIRPIYLIRPPRPTSQRKKTEIGDRISECYDQHTAQL